MESLVVDLDYAGYVGRENAIQDIRFKVNSGEIVGLIGSNGAGKSTTIKAIAGLLPKVNGEVSFKGQDKTYAYIPEQPILYDGLTLSEHLELAASAYEIDRVFFESKVEDLLGQFNLSAVKHHFPVNFSKGMQQKVMITIGLLIQPGIYIIDEPFVGLDHRATMSFVDLLEKEKARKAGILISTHQLHLAERVCDSFIFMDNGRVIARGSIKQIQEKCYLPNASLFDCFKYILENDNV